MIVQVVEELKVLRCEELVSACGNRSVDRDAELKLNVPGRCLEA